MELNLYAIHDAVSGTYAQPNCAINDATAARSAKDLLTRDTNLAAHRDDYALFRIGKYNDVTGLITGLEKPELIVKLGTLT